MSLASGPWFPPSVGAFELDGLIRRHLHLCVATLVTHYQPRLRRCISSLGNLAPKELGSSHVYRLSQNRFCTRLTLRLHLLLTSLSQYRGRGCNHVHLNSHASVQTLV